MFGAITNDFSTEVVHGLQHLGTIISLDLTEKIIKQCIKLTLYPQATITPIPEAYASDAYKVKQSEYAIVTLLALAIKHGCDVGELKRALDEINVNDRVVEQITRHYSEHRKELTLRQMQIAHSFPHVTDLQWRIVCDAKSSSTTCSSGEVSFNINLGRFESNGDRKTITEFVCNTEELQLLINKLREIERHCDKAISI